MQIQRQEETFLLSHYHYEMYGRLRGAKVFTTLDLRSGYYHISLSEMSKAKTAFVTPFGKYQFKAVPFGLAQAPAYFEQLISMVLQGCSEFAMAYLDDIIIFSKNEVEHLKHIEVIFQKLKEAGLKLKEAESIISLKRRFITWDT